VTSNRNKAKVELNSITPFLKSYGMKEMPDGNWKDFSNAVEIELLAARLNDKQTNQTDCNLTQLKFIIMTTK